MNCCHRHCYDASVIYCSGAGEGYCLTQVQVRPNESLDSALKRFKKQLQQTGILKEAREHEHYEKPSDKKRKAEAAAKRKMRAKSEDKEKQ